MKKSLIRNWLLTAVIAVLLSLGILPSARPQSQTGNRACSSDIHKMIEGALAETGKLHDMPNRQVYQLPVGGKIVTGQGDDFLRLRSGPEILASGLACGCGDYAISFIYLMEQCGFQANLVDSAEISTQSLRSRLSGHAVVAVRDMGTGRWILADPTNHRVISEDWSPTDKTFYGNYWIGFFGPLASYPAHDPASLRQFYDATLKAIPIEVLNEHLFRFRFTVDPSLIGENGEYLNPNLTALLRDNGKFLRDASIHPSREIEIRLIKGGDDARSTLDFSDKTGWVCTVGLRSACSPSFTSYLETRVARHLNGN